MDHKKRILLMCQGDASWSPRTIRFAKALRDNGMHVTVASAPLTRHIDIDEHIQIGSERKHKTKIGRFFQRYGYFAIWLPKKGRMREAIHSYRFQLGNISKTLQKKNYDIILVQDLALLPAVFSSRIGARIYFDAREYYPLQNEEDRKFLKYEKPERERVCETYLPRCSGVMTVSHGIATAYQKNFNIEPKVIFSVSDFKNLSATPVENKKIKLVYHGAANLNRGLVDLFDLISELPDRFTLDLYLVSKSRERIREFERYAGDILNVNIHPPVPFEKIIETLNQFDIGLIFYKASNFNLKNCMPNKLFEYIQARLAVAIGPSPDMAKFLSENSCGIISETFSIGSLADALKNESAQTIYKKKVYAEVAAKIYCSQAQADELVNFFGEGEAP